MSRSPRLSQQGLLALKAILENPLSPLSGADISRATGIGSGTLYPLLDRFESSGWLTSKWEEVEPQKVGRPRRRLYKLTGEGERAARAAFSEIELRSGRFAWSS